MAKFNYYIKGTNEKVRTSANIYTHAVVENRADGSRVCRACSGSKDLASKAKESLRPFVTLDEKHFNEGVVCCLPLVNPKKYEALKATHEYVKSTFERYGRNNEKVAMFKATADELAEIKAEMERKAAYMASLEIVEIEAR